MLLAARQDEALVDLSAIAFVLLVSIPRFHRRGVSLLEPEGLLRIVPFPVKDCWVLQLSGEFAWARFSACILWFGWARKSWSWDTLLHNHSWVVAPILLCIMALYSRCRGLHNGHRLQPTKIVEGSTHLLHFLLINFAFGEQRHFLSLRVKDFLALIASATILLSITWLTVINTVEIVWLHSRILLWQWRRISNVVGHDINWLVVRRYHLSLVVNNSVASGVDLGRIGRGSLSDELAWCSVSSGPLPLLISLCSLAVTRMLNIDVFEVSLIFCRACVGQSTPEGESIIVLHKGLSGR